MKLLRYSDKFWVVGGVIIAVVRGETEPEVYALPNVITTVGKQRAASHLGSTPSKTWFTHIAVGDNSDTPVATGDLALASEIHREALDSVWVSGVTVFGQFSITASDIGSGSQTIRELGLLDAASGGNLITHQNLVTAITISGSERIDGLWGVIVT